MPKSNCLCCGTTYTWSWEEAFSSVGFNFGKNSTMTTYVIKVLTYAGYSVDRMLLSRFNTGIIGLTKDGRDLIPDGANIGTAPPRNYLPQEVIRLLDWELGPEVEVTT